VKDNMYVLIMTVKFYTGYVGGITMHSHEFDSHETATEAGIAWSKAVEKEYDSAEAVYVVMKK